MIYLYFDYEGEIIKINCVEIADAVSRFKSCKKKWPHIKLICFANGEYMKSEKIKIKFEHERSDEE